MVSYMGTAHIPPCVHTWAKELGPKWPQMFLSVQKCYAFGTRHNLPAKNELVRHTVEHLCSGHKDVMSFI